MCVAGDIGKNIPKQAVNQPWRHAVRVGFRHQIERYLKFVEPVVASLVHARRLAGRPDEQA